MVGSSSAPRVLRPSSDAVEFVSEPPDAKLPAKVLASCRRRLTWARRNKLDAVAIGMDSLAVPLLTLATHYPFVKSVAETVKTLYSSTRSAFVPIYHFRSSGHAAPRTQSMKGNVADVEDLRKITEDLIVIVAGRIDQLGDGARDDIETLHECAHPLISSPPGIVLKEESSCFRSLIGVVSGLVDLAQSKGLPPKAVGTLRLTSGPGRSRSSRIRSLRR